MDTCSSSIQQCKHFIQEKFRHRKLLGLPDQSFEHLVGMGMKYIAYEPAYCYRRVDDVFHPSYPRNLRSVDRGVSSVTDGAA